MGTNILQEGKEYEATVKWLSFSHRSLAVPITYKPLSLDSMHPFSTSRPATIFDSRSNKRVISRYKYILEMGTDTFWEGNEEILEIETGTKTFEMGTNIFEEGNEYILDGNKYTLRRGMRTFLRQEQVRLRCHQLY